MTAQSIYSLSKTHESTAKLKRRPTITEGTGGYGAEKGKLSPQGEELSKKKLVNKEFICSVTDIEEQEYSVLILALDKVTVEKFFAQIEFYPGGLKISEVE